MEIHHNFLNIFRVIKQFFGDVKKRMISKHSRSYRVVYPFIFS